MEIGNYDSEDISWNSISWKTRFGKIQTVKFKSEDTNRKNRPAKHKSGNKSRKYSSRITNRKTAIRKIHIGKYKSEKYNMGITIRKNTNQKTQIGRCRSEEYKSENTDWKIQTSKYKSENTYRELQAGNTNMKIQVGKYKSENTNRKNTNRNIQLGKVQFG